jgi:GTPase SAR1 family protein
MLLQEAVTDVPVVLVGNKTDQWGDRMVTLEEGQRRSKEIGCVCFHEISVRESIEQVDTSSKTVLITELSLTKAVVIQSQCSMPLTRNLDFKHNPGPTKSTFHSPILSLGKCPPSVLSHRVYLQ